MQRVGNKNIFTENVKIAYFIGSLVLKVLVCYNANWKEIGSDQQVAFEFTELKETFSINEN